MSLYAPPGYEMKAKTTHPPVKCCVCRKAFEPVPAQRKATFPCCGGSKCKVVAKKMWREAAR